MNDNIHIFHLVPSKPVYDLWNCYRKVQEKVAWSCEHQKVDISPVLSYSTPIVNNALTIKLDGHDCEIIGCEHTFLNGGYQVDRSKVEEVV